MNTGNGNNTLTWKLPDVVDPPDTICVTLRIPNNKLHIEAFKGAIFDLSYWWNWEKDSAHTAARVARVWRKVFYEMTFSRCGEQPPVLIFDEEINMPPFRMDCHGTLFVTDCNGVEHCIAYCSQLPGAGSPGAGTPQPGAGGGNQEYCQKLDANKQMLIPTPLNSGDKIELVSAEGSWWDGGENAVGFPVWRCPDGEYFFAGNCQGSSTKRVTGTDPAVAAAHMALVVKIGSNYYDLTSGVFTVPGGVSGATAVIQVNDTDITNNQGSADVCIKVTNNQPVSTTWSHTFDLTANVGGFTVPVSFPYGHWSPGIGWESDVRIVHGSPPQVETLAIERLPDFSVAPVTDVIISYTLPPSGDSAWNANVNFYSGGFGGTLVGTAALTAASGTYVDLSVAVSIPATWDTVAIEMGADRQDTVAIECSKLTLKGTGIDPFA